MMDNWNGHFSMLKSHWSLTFIVAYCLTSMHVSKLATAELGSIPILQEQKFCRVDNYGICPLSGNELYLEHTNHHKHTRMALREGIVCMQAL